MGLTGQMCIWFPQSARSPLPDKVYVTEDGADFYITEDGTKIYTPEDAVSPP